MESSFNEHVDWATSLMSIVKDRGDIQQEVDVLFRVPPLGSDTIKNRLGGSPMPGTERGAVSRCVALAFTPAGLPLKPASIPLAPIHETP